jgi:hypothetical protein
MKSLTTYGQVAVNYGVAAVNSRDPVFFRCRSQTTILGRGRPPTVSTTVFSINGQPCYVDWSILL